MTERTILGIFGSRSLNDERVKILILDAIAQWQPAYLVTTQEPQGVCEVAQRVAKETAIPLILHFLNFRYLRGAFEHRSKEVVKECSHFLLIHDGVSKGTANELKLVKKSGKPYLYEILKVTPYQRSVGFNIKQDWGTDENESESGEVKPNLENLSIDDIIGELR